MPTDTELYILGFAMWIFGFVGGGVIGYTYCKVRNYLNGRIK